MTPSTVKQPGRPVLYCPARAPVFFQSLRSGSSGNCLALWDGRSSVLFDCGIRRQYECRDILARHQRKNGKVDAVLVSHAHGDHMAYASLRVLQREHIRIHAHRRVIDQINHTHGLAEWDDPPTLHTISREAVRVGGFSVSLVEVPHAPHFPNYGFVVVNGGRKAVIFTDLHDADGALEHFVDADFIFVEANHDLDLLRANPNPASRYHLNNRKTAQLLCRAVRQAKRAPSTVMLGHLSDERNRPQLAIGEVKQQFKDARMEIGFDLLTAPRDMASNVIQIG